MCEYIPIVQQFTHMDFMIFQSSSLMPDFIGY